MPDQPTVLRLTAELRHCLDRIAEAQCQSVAATVETLLRRSPEVRTAARELGIEWREKERPGRRARDARA